MTINKESSFIQLISIFEINQIRSIKEKDAQAVFPTLLL